MIFPIRSDYEPILKRLSARGVARASQEAFEPRQQVVPVYPAASRQRFFPRASFSAQLLALGLRYGMDDLVNKADAAVSAQAHPVGSAVRSYAMVQEAFFRDERPALFARWSA